MLTELALQFLSDRHIESELAAQYGLDSYAERDGGEGVKFPFLVGENVVNH